MSDERDTCLTATEILAWAEGTLPEDPGAAASRHLENCRLCAAAVEGLAEPESRQGFVEGAEWLRGRVRARTATARRASTPTRLRRPRSWAPPYVALAATLVVAIGTVVMLTRPTPGEALFQRYFEPYPSTQPVVRGSQPGLAGADGAQGRPGALALYEAGDYRQALALLDKTLERDRNEPVALFYAGLCRLALRQPRQAVRDLREVQKVAPSEIQGPAEWYLALALLRNGDLAEARSTLDQLVRRGGFYQDRARALLSELDRVHAIG